MTDRIKKLRNIPLLAFTVLLMACNSAKIDSGMEQDSVSNEGPKIVFVSYKFSKDINGKVTLSLIDVLKAEGKLKPYDDEVAYFDGDYELIQFDSRGKQLTLKKIENPLNQTIEFVNEQGEFEKKEVEFPSKEVSIRLQLHSETKYILIQEIGNESINFVKTYL